MWPAPTTPPTSTHTSPAAAERPAGVSGPARVLADLKSLTASGSTYCTRAQIGGYLALEWSQGHWFDYGQTDLEPAGADVQFSPPYPPGGMSGGLGCGLGPVRGDPPPLLSRPGDHEALSGLPRPLPCRLRYRAVTLARMPGWHPVRVRQCERWPCLSRLSAVPRMRRHRRRPAGPGP